MNNKSVVFVKHLKIFTRLNLNKYSTKIKASVSLDEKVRKDLENETIKPRKHPGIIKNKNTQLPSYIEKAISVSLKDYPVKAIVYEATKLSRYLNARHPPMEDVDIGNKISEIQNQIEVDSGVESDKLGAEELDHIRKLNKTKVMNILKQKVYSWKSIQYNEYRSLQYLVGRAAPEYAVLLRIFNEIKDRCADFKPRSFLDFGSGVGTGTWAVRNFWESTIFDYFCVDSSGDMNDLAGLILRGGNDNNQLPVRGLLYRQFLPASANITYDIVLSAYTLMELPNTQNRLENLINLWNKTEQFLIIVEQGTNAGFKLVNEARDFLLEQGANIFAPCPHTQTCPRFTTDRTPCNFEVNYKSLNIGSNSEIKHEQFSYIVLMKGDCTHVSGSQWPRIVRPTLVRSKHTICRMCTSNGHLKEIIFTPTKHGKIPYRCARASKWGDLLPIEINESNSNSDTDTNTISNKD